MRRVLDTVRIQTANWPATFGWPLGILAVAFLANLAIFSSIGDAAVDGGSTTGAITSIYFVMFVAHVQTMTQYFPLALGLSVTRRTFFWSAVTLIAAQSAVFGTVITVLLQIERATDGWGIDMTFYGIGFLEQDGLVAQWLVYTVPFLALCAIGLFLGVLLKRWGPGGAYVAAIGGAAVLAGAIALVSWQQWWPAVGSFFTEQPTLALLAGYPMLVALAAGTGSYLAIRRAVP